MSEYQEFLKRMNLEEYPFSTFTTENEKGKEEKLFIKPEDYFPIIQSFDQGNTIILIGDRGTGKTAILLELERLLTQDRSLFCVVDDFSYLPTKFKSHNLYNFLISKISIVLFLRLSNSTKRINRLNNEDKVLLSYLLKNFVPIVSKRILKEKIEKIQISWYKRFGRKLFNLFRGGLNYGATIGTVVIDEYIATHFKQLPSIEKSVNVKDFFPELPDNVDNSFNDIKVSYQLLNDVLNLINKLNFERIVLLVDKIDEDERLGNNGEAIANFITPLLTDNKLLLNSSLQLIISMWSTPFNYLLENVRTQKHYSPKISWSKTDLVKALNTRLSVFSKNKVSNYKDLFSSDYSDQDFEILFNLSNGNPRDLWHLMDKLVKSQFKANQGVSKIEKNIMNIGIKEFIETFNYYEYYPRKLNAQSNTMDFYSYTAHLLKLNSHEFSKNQLNEQAGIGSSTNNYVVGMERIGLIEKKGQEGGITKYKIKDPKVIYTLNNNIRIEK